MYSVRIANNDGPEPRSPYLDAADLAPTRAWRLSASRNSDTFPLGTAEERHNAFRWNNLIRSRAGQWYYVHLSGVQGEQDYAYAITTPAAARLLAGDGWDPASLPADVQDAVARCVATV